MKSLISFDPFREFDSLSNRLARLLNDTSREETNDIGFAPPVDISEGPEAYHFKAELPSVKKENIKVTLENGILTLTGSKSHERETKNDDRKFHRIERGWGTFSRSFQLPENVDHSKVEAKFDNGVLDVTVVKKREEESKTSHIQIK